MENQLFNLKFSAKQLNKAAIKCEKEEKKEKAKVRAAIEKQNMEGARIYAQNAIRQKNQVLHDAVASRVESAMRMKQVIGNLGKISQQMDMAMQSMDLERISSVMDNFEKQFEDMDVRSSYVEGAMNQTTAISTPQSEVDTLIAQVADENNLVISEQLNAADPARERPTGAKDADVDDMMARLNRQQTRGINSLPSVNDPTRELAELRLLVQELRKEVRYLGGCKTEAKRLSEENEKIKHEIQEVYLLRDKNSKLEGRILFYQEQVDRAAAVENENASLRTELEKWTTHFLEGSLKDIHTPQELATFIGDMQCENAMLKSQEGTSAARVHNLEHERDKYKNECEKQQRKTEAAEMKMRQLAIKAESETKQNATLSRQMEMLQKLLDSCGSTISEETVQSMQKEMQSLVKTSLIERSEKEQNHKCMDGENERLRSQLSDCHARVSVLEHELEELKSKTNDMDVTRRTELDLMERSMAYESPVPKKKRLLPDHDQPVTMDMLSAPSVAGECTQCKIHEVAITALKLRVTEAEQYAAEMESRIGRGEYDRSKTKVLHFTMNPEKKAVEEHMAEMARLKEGVRNSVPKPPQSPSSTAQVAAAQAEIAELQHRIVRLKDVFKEKITEFREACSVLTGYKVEMTQDTDGSMYKLKSIYGRDDDALLFRVAPDTGYQLLATDFSTGLKEAVEAYLVKCHSIPAFTAHVTMELFNRNTYISP